MRSLWQRFVTALTPGVQVMLIVLTGVYVASVIGRMTQTIDLAGWLAVSTAVWHGQVWRLVTYALLPAGIMDFLMNAFALVLIGSMLERHWSRGELWQYSAIAAAGAGLTQVLLSGAPMTGAAPMVFGLLIAWAFICGHEVLTFPLFGQMTVRQMVLIMAAVSFIVMFLTAGWVRAAVMVSGGVTGWLYLWLRCKWLLARPGRKVESGRINRLEF
jgi:membrane associated rhomboid family serine protease